MLKPGQLPPQWARLILYYNVSANEVAVPLGDRSYLDTEGNAVASGFSLQAFGAQVLVAPAMASFVEWAGKKTAKTSAPP